MDELEAYHDTAVFGPHRWSIRGTSNRVIAGAQFTSQHDAETALKVGRAIYEMMKEVMAERINEVLR